VRFSQLDRIDAKPQQLAAAEAASDPSGDRVIDME